MLDLKFIRENSEIVRIGIRKKHRSETVLDEVLKLDQKRRELIQKTEFIKAQKNKASEKISKLKGLEKEKEIKKMRALSTTENKLNPNLQKIESKLTELLSQIPNLPLPSVPEGKDENENQIIRTIGQKAKFDFEPKDHVTLGKNLALIDIESATQMSGARFYYLKNEAVLLEFALVHFIFNKLIAKGFTPVVPPVLVKEEAMWATGFFPADKNEIYQVNSDDDKLFLVGTSEVSLTMLHANKIIENEKNLPLRYAGFSTCFRREAGSYGKDVHGILRVHQFDKIEMFSFCHPLKAEAEHEFILSIEEEIMKELGFHYQVVNCCGGESGYAAAKKYDIEVWIPTQKKFRELTSCSNCTDYQARRAKIKFKTENGDKEFIHTLNGTACAIGRTLIALIENYQNKDGSITIPEILRPYLGFKEKISRH